MGEPVFTQEQDVWDWLDALRRHRSLIGGEDAEQAWDLMAAALRRVAALRFDGRQLDRGLIAQHAGVSPEDLAEVLGEGP
ncbi:hypothetical protein GCM10027174_07770 [Salinifilum aidingensis]